MTITANHRICQSHNLIAQYEYINQPSCSLALSLDSPFFGEIFAYVTVFQSNHSGSHIPSSWMLHAGCVFVADIHLSKTWMPGSSVSMRWNAYVHSLDLSLYSHMKEFWGNGVRTHVNSKGKVPSTGKILLRGGLKPWCCIKQDSQPNALFRPNQSEILYTKEFVTSVFLFTADSTTSRLITFKLARQSHAQPTQWYATIQTACSEMCSHTHTHTHTHACNTYIPFTVNIQRYTQIFKKLLTSSRSQKPHKQSQCWCVNLLQNSPPPPSPCHGSQRTQETSSNMST